MPSIGERVVWAARHTELAKNSLQENVLATFYSLATSELDGVYESVVQRFLW